MLKSLLLLALLSMLFGTTVIFTPQVADVITQGILQNIGELPQ